MKKKLLTVLLAVVMVFGVFSLAACGDKVNPDSEYRQNRNQRFYGGKEKNTPGFPDGAAVSDQRHSGNSVFSGKYGRDLF